MLTELQSVVADALACLIAVARDGARPPEARLRLRATQERHPNVGMELVWEEEPFDGSVHYDVLLRPAGGGTVSLSYCLDHALPWPLRGVRRWSDMELALVNGQVLKMQEAVNFLDLLWDEAPILTRMINACLVREELERRPLELSDEELQLGVDGLRRAHKLYTAEETHRWMQQRGVTHERFEQLAADSLTLFKLRERVTAGRIERYFEEHPGALDTAGIATIECSDEASALRIYHRVRTGELDFWEAAERQFAEAQVDQVCTFAMLRRHEATDELGVAVFGAAPGDVVGPIAVGERHVVARILVLRSARLDAPTRAAIAELLFEEWLAERRQTASITWYWGTADRAPHAA